MTEQRDWRERCIRCHTVGMHCISANRTSESQEASQDCKCIFVFVGRSEIKRKRGEGRVSTAVWKQR